LLLVVAAATGAWAQPIVETTAGTGVAGFNGDGPATAAQLSLPRAVAVGPNQRVHVCDRFNNRIRRIEADGTLVTVAGSGEQGFDGDGGPATAAAITSPNDIAVAPDGTLYIADALANHRVRRVSPAGIITTFAGNGFAAGDRPPVGVASDVNMSPDALAVDGNGKLYVSDAFTILRVRPDGTFTTLTDGLAGALAGMAVDAEGNLYVTESGRNSVRLVRPDGTIEPFAGAGAAGFGGDGGAATAALLNNPRGIAIDTQGNVYIADTGNQIIRVVDPDGSITSYAGDGTLGFADGPAAAARFADPSGIAADPFGTLYIADEDNHRIRAIRPDGLPFPYLTREGVVNAASFFGGAIAPDSIVSLFGRFLALTDATGFSFPLLTTLGGTAVEITDSLGVTRRAGLFGVFRETEQINLYLDRATAPGPARVTVLRGDGRASSVTVEVAAVAPGIFFQRNDDGQAVALAQFLRFADGVSGPLQFTFSVLDFSLIPIDLGPEGDQIFLALFGTGFRFASGVENISATIDGEPVPVLGFAAAAGFVGLDQVNIGPVPRSFIGRGVVAVVLTIDGKVTNPALVRFL
jgi:uncharacterized protein (TIGR03437 family)